MMRKFFCRISKNHTTYVKVGGADKKVVFDNSAGNAAGFGEFLTDDRDLIEAMMGDPRHDNDWFVEDLTETQEKKTVPEVELTEHVCRTVNEATEWLTELGCKKSEVNTSGRAVEAAHRLGFELVFDKGE